MTQKKRQSVLVLASWLLLLGSILFLVLWSGFFGKLLFYILLILGWGCLLTAACLERSALLQLPLYGLLTVLYVLFQSISWGDSSLLLRVLGTALALGFLILYVSNLFFPFLLLKKEISARDMLLAAFFGKLAMIPMFVLVFLMGFVMLILPATFMMTPILVVLDYLLLLVTSVWSICGMEKARRQGLLSKGSQILHTVLQLLFCLDVVSSAYVCWKTGKKKRADGAL